MTHSWLAPFSPAWRTTLERALSRTDTRRVACFDADGTLWDEDLGEAFLRWLVAGRLLKTIDCTSDVWGEYERRVHASRSQGYAWAVELMAGLAEDDVLHWSRQLAHAWPNYRPAMLELAHGLMSEGFEVWIVSASNRWSIHAAAERMRFPVERALGIQSKVAAGLLTNEVRRPLTSEGGKVDVITQTIGVRPMLAFGDSMGDFAMLEHAEHPLIATRVGRKPNALVEHALKHGWPIHEF